MMSFQAILMNDYDKPEPFPEDLFTPFGFVYQAYILMSTKDTGMLLFVFSACGGIRTGNIMPVLAFDSLLARAG